MPGFTVLTMDTLQTKCGDTKVVSSEMCLSQATTIFAFK